MSSKYTFSKLFLILSIFSILPGQLVRLSLTQNTAVTFTDFITLITIFVFVVETLKLKAKAKIPPTFFVPLLLFVLYSISSNIFAIPNLGAWNVLISSLFLLRFIVYSSLAIVASNVVGAKGENWVKLVITIGVGFCLIGFLQLFFYSDLTYLANFGWDPHQNRIVSSFLDPNFAGYVYTLLATFAISLYLFNRKLIYLGVFVGDIIALTFTFSRSSYLAFFAAVVVLGILKSPKFLLLGALFAFFIFLSVPRVQTRVLGAITIDETAQARIVSWQNSLRIIRDNPVFGVGFDAYRYAQERSGLFNFDSPQGGHSGAGVDSSLLLVMATTGIIGFLFFLVFLLSILKKIASGSRENVVKLASFASFAALLVHSQFVNSFFFPQIMVLIWPMVGLSLSYDS